MLKSPVRWEPDDADRFFEAATALRDLEDLGRGWSEVVLGCTTEARNTHKTELREIIYPWHPWHGQRVLVRGEARRGGSTVLRCVRDEFKGFLVLEIPEWMLDANLCGRMKGAEIPRVDCAA